MQGTFVTVNNDGMALSHSHYVMDMGYFNANHHLCILHNLWLHLNAIELVLEKREPFFKFECW